MELRKILICGYWKESSTDKSFQAFNPATGEKIGDLYPVSTINEVNQAVKFAAETAYELLSFDTQKIADFLERYAEYIENDADSIAKLASLETGLAFSPRLKDIELKRTVNQLRQAAEACRNKTYAMPVIDKELNICSMYGPLGKPVIIFGPNNFPLAFNSVSGGDFAATIAAGNPVIAIGNYLHPGTTALLAEHAYRALKDSGMPSGTLQLFFKLEPSDGLKLVSSKQIGAVAFTGSRKSGLILKKAAEAAGNLFYMETGSINPVIILEDAINERSEAILEELAFSCLLGGGQFCTKPGLVFVVSREAESFIDNFVEIFKNRPVPILLSSKVIENLEVIVKEFQENGAELLTGGRRLQEKGFRFENTVLKVSCELFIKKFEIFQKEAFGNCVLFVNVKSVDLLLKALRFLEGNLTGSIYTAKNSSSQTKEAYKRIERILRVKVGRLLNDKMPTGVAVCPAMNHGGPYPATSHPGFTAVGLPASIRRFTMLMCYDNVRQERLPELFGNF